MTVSWRNWECIMYVCICCMYVYMYYVCMKECVYVCVYFSFTSVWGLPFAHDLFTLEHSSKTHSNWRVLESNPDLHIFCNADLWAPFLPLSRCYLIDIPLMGKAYVNDSGRAGTGEGWCFLERVTGVRGPSEENMKEREDKAERVTGFG